jgi:hypothetical protein
VAPTGEAPGLVASQVSSPSRLPERARAAPGAGPSTPHFPLTPRGWSVYCACFRTEARRNQHEALWRVAHPRFRANPKWPCTSSRG